MTWIDLGLMRGPQGDQGPQGDPGTTTWAGITDKPLIPDSPDDIGAATAAQGAKADTALQPSTGIVAVDHGSDPNVPRPPDAAVVYWRGTVAPALAVAGDLGYGW